MSSRGYHIGTVLFRIILKHLSCYEYGGPLCAHKRTRSLSWYLRRESFEVCLSPTRIFLNRKEQSKTKSLRIWKRFDHDVLCILRAWQYISDLHSRVLALGLNGTCVCLQMHWPSWCFIHSRSVCDVWIESLALLRLIYVTVSSYWTRFAWSGRPGLINLSSVALAQLLHATFSFHKIGRETKSRVSFQKKTQGGNLITFRSCAAPLWPWLILRKALKNFMCHWGSVCRINKLTNVFISTAYSCSIPFSFFSFRFVFLCINLLAENIEETWYKFIGSVQADSISLCPLGTCVRSEGLQVIPLFLILPI